MKNQNELHDDVLKDVAGGVGYDPTASMAPKVVERIKIVVRDQKAAGNSFEECILKLQSLFPMFEETQKKAGNRYLQVGGGYLSDEDVYFFAAQLWNS